MFELAQSSEQSPPPVYDPIYAGLIGAAIVGAIVMSFMGFAGFADHSQPVALGVVVALGFLIPFGFLKLQDRLHSKRRRPPGELSVNH
jgi:hypothetical protein